jgi:peptidyl-dipeptidase A
MPQPDGSTRTVTPNQIQEILTTSTNVEERLRAWETSKQAGPALKAGLLELRDLRNRVAREMGHSSFFALQVADYGLSVAEMRALTDRLVAELRPLYAQLHCWARHKLAARYGQPVPKLIPAHWLPNRWGQEWGGLVDTVDLDAPLKTKSPEWLVKAGEQFYVSLGFPALPPTFWTKSDLYELPPDAKRKKNTHASAWHINLDQDVRSLMSVKPDFEWFTTTHHELGHVYYYLSYARPEVPVVLREGANRAFHEGIGELITTAVRQPPYLEQMGILKPGEAPDQIQWLLNEALTEAAVFIPWSAGVMTAWEHDFYEQELPADQLNRRWWEQVAKYQGIAPPAPRGEEFCDAATKTHIIDDPAQYYDYALAFALKYQFHRYIAQRILKQPANACNYHGNRAVGKFLADILKLGATRDWRKVLRQSIGEDISAKAMLEYYAPLMKYLEEQNRGREVGW